MPGKGKYIERSYDENESKAIDAEAKARAISAMDVRKLLGETTCDVYLNGAAYWRNIPLNVWEYYIGGYQVIKKWLSYREDKILGLCLEARRGSRSDKHGPAHRSHHSPATHPRRELPQGEGRDL